jgi:hypothetical protein
MSIKLALHAGQCLGAELELGFDGATSFCSTFKCGAFHDHAGNIGRGASLGTLTDKLELYAGHGIGAELKLGFGANGATAFCLNFKSEAFPDHTGNIGSGAHASFATLFPKTGAMAGFGTRVLIGSVVMLILGFLALGADNSGWSCNPN